MGPKHSGWENTDGRKQWHGATGIQTWLGWRYLHSRRCCRATGVHSLDVAWLTSSHHKAPTNGVTDNLERKPQLAISRQSLAICLSFQEKENQPKIKCVPSHLSSLCHLNLARRAKHFASTPSTGVSLQERGSRDTCLAERSFFCEGATQCITGRLPLS